MSSDDDDASTFFHREHNRNINSRIMMAAIISLSFVVIIVTILHIYARCVLRRQAQRRAALGHLTLIVTNSESFRTNEPPKTGLDPAVIAVLPLFVFKQTNINGSNSTCPIGSVECSVCLSMLEDGEMARTLPNCKHTFHADCIDKWFGTNSTCPICRMEAQPRLVAEPREGVVGGEAPSAPPLEGTSSDGGPAKINSGSSSRFSSFRRMLNRERSLRRMQNQSCGQEEHGVEDVERQ